MMRPRSTPNDSWLRIALSIFGATCLLWTGLVLLRWPHSEMFERLSDRILQGERYKAVNLDRVAPTIASLEVFPWSRARTLRATTVITLRKAETAMSEGRRAAIDEHMKYLASLLPRTLAAVPSDAFLWLALFWYDNLTSPIERTALRKLKMSYRTGPREGWIGVRRSRLALAIYSRLPENLQELAGEEFAGLVHSRFSEMPEILGARGWAARESLLRHLERIPDRDRKLFAARANRLGYEIDVPGVERPEARPWIR